MLFRKMKDVRNRMERPDKLAETELHLEPAGNQLADQRGNTHHIIRQVLRGDRHGGRVFRQNRLSPAQRVFFRALDVHLDEVDRG